MYKIIENYFSFKDERGEIKGLINFENWQEVNCITSYKGTVRGGHYHKKTKEAIIVLSGKIKVDIRKNSESECFVIEKGDVILLVSGGHGFECIEEVEMRNCCPKTMPPLSIGVITGKCPALNSLGN